MTTLTQNGGQASRGDFSESEGDKSQLVLADPSARATIPSGGCQALVYYVTCDCLRRIDTRGPERALVLADPDASVWLQDCAGPRNGRAAGIERTDAPYTFRREGDYWTVSYDGPPVRLRDRRGLGYIARLLERPGENRHVFDVIGSCAVGGLASRYALAAQSQLGLADAGNACDVRARNEYRGRLADLEVELDDAREANDLGQVERLQREREQLTRELARAFGLGGRPRRVAAAVERARINVRNSIVNALKAMEGREARLFRHLRVSIRTGTYCAYRPERAMRWVL